MRFLCCNLPLRAPLLPLTDLCSVQHGTLLAGDPAQTIYQYLQSTNGAQPWNYAPAGPANGTSQTPVQFGLADINAMQNNANNQSDFLIQLQGQQKRAVTV